MPNYHVTVHGTGREALADLVRVHGLRVYAQTLDEQPTDPRVDAIADDATIGRLVAAGFRVDRHEDIDQAAQESIGEVGQGNRYATDEGA